MRSAIIVCIAIVLIGLLLTGLTFVNYRFSIENPGGNDFLARGMGARYWLVKGISPYDEQVSLATQQMIYGHPADPSIGEDKNHFVYPLPSMIFFGLFGLVDYPLARALWMTTLELCLFGLAIVGVRLADWEASPWKMAVLLLFSLLWYHSARTIIIGQFAAINALLIALSLLLIKNKQDFVAGLILSMSIAKPQMSFLILPYVIIWALLIKRWELFWGILSGMVILMGVSLALMPDWPVQMLRQLLDYPSYTHIGSPLSIIANSMPGVSRQISIFLHLFFIGYLLLEWVISWRKDMRHFIWTALMTLVITNLIVFRTATTNYVMLLPVLFYIFAIWEVRWKLTGQFFMWLSLAGLGIGLWALFLLTVEGNVEQAIMYLPLPIFSLFGLWWVRWWAIKPPRLMMTDSSSQ
jgi:hypothetical protein